jgi:hypothetical protein
VSFFILNKRDEGNSRVSRSHARIEREEEESRSKAGDVGCARQRPALNTQDFAKGRKEQANLMGNCRLLWFMQEGSFSHLSPVEKVSAR